MYSSYMYRSNAMDFTLIPALYVISVMFPENLSKRACDWTRIAIWFAPDAYGMLNVK